MQKTGPLILKDISTLQAISWIYRAWCETEPLTIVKSFNKVGFYDKSKCGKTNESIISEDEFVNEDDFPLSVVKLELFDCEVTELIDFDGNFKTCDTVMSEWDKNANDIIEYEYVDDACDDWSDEQSDVTSNESMFKCVMDFDELLVEMKVAKLLNRQPITDFFQKPE